MRSFIGKVGDDGALSRLRHQRKGSAQRALSAVPLWPNSASWDSAVSVRLAGGGDPVDESGAGVSAQDRGRSMMKPLRVFIAGPYTHFDLVVNVRQAVLAGVEIVQAGHTPFIPHLFHFAHLLSPQPDETWTTLSLRWLETCHFLLRLHGYSPGADVEVERAQYLRIPVYYNLPDCLAALPLREYERSVR
jgi:hypothetical protein